MVVSTARPNKTLCGQACLLQGQSGMVQRDGLVALLHHGGDDERGGEQCGGPRAWHGVPT